MEVRSLGVLTADLKHEALEMNRTAAVDDFDSARFWAASIAAKASHAGFADIQTAAFRVLLYLGPAETAPTPGFGHAMLHLADLLIALEDRIQASE